MGCLLIVKNVIFSLSVSAYIFRICKSTRIIGIFLVFKIQENYFKAKFQETPKVHCSVLSFPQTDLFQRHSRPLLLSCSALPPGRRSCPSAPLTLALKGQSVGRTKPSESGKSELSWPNDYSSLLRYILDEDYSYFHSHVTLDIVLFGKEHI